MSGGNCSWIIKLAERVVKALPPVLNRAAVPALEIAANKDGATNPSSPPFPPPVILEFPLAPLKFSCSPLHFSIDSKSIEEYTLPTFNQMCPAKLPEQGVP